MRLLLQLLVRLVIRAGRVSHIEPTLVVEGGRDGPLNQRGADDQAYLKAVRHAEGLAGKFELCCVSSQGDNESGNAVAANERALHKELSLINLVQSNSAK